MGLVRDWVHRSRSVRDGILSRIDVVRGELEDLAFLERVLNEYEIETVFHLGAQTIVGTANRGPVSTFESNIRGTWNLLEAARRTSTVGRVVVASSDKAYGMSEELPYTEETPLAGRHPYDVSKSCADLISRSYFETFALPVCVTRCGNFFGEGDLNFSRLVPGTIRSVLRDECPVIRSNGLFVRDYFYALDGALAYVNLAEAMDRPEVVGEAFNFGNETPMTVVEITESILALMDRMHLKPVILNEANSEILAQCLSAAKARSLLNWRPVYSFQQAMVRTIRWYRGLLCEDDGNVEVDTEAA